MIHLLGQAVWPTFQVDAWVDQLATALDRPVSLAARTWLVIDQSKAAPAALCQVLDAEPVTPAAFQPGTDVLIAPRPGTQTPWASRAGDILTRCGLAPFSSLERFFHLRFEGVGVDELPVDWQRGVFDRMTQVWLTDWPDAKRWFNHHHRPTPVATLAWEAAPLVELNAENERLGLALSDNEMAYLVDLYRSLERPPTDAELMMFAQANSEHCRHKIFNAHWTIDGQDAPERLFGMIKHTHQASPEHTIVAYDDNAAVIEGGPSTLVLTDADHTAYRIESGVTVHTQIKVETHNHPTAISPDPGAATGAGGEIRDESATGRGARPVAGLVGFSVSDLKLSTEHEPWAHAPNAPGRLASALAIMTEGPIGAARYNNEFGRPNLLGYFRSFAGRVGGRWWGYHKPIMLAGGSGLIRGEHTHKHALSPGDHIVVLGGPAMLIGLGGGAASSMSSGQSDEALDYASVQRGNPEMERRAQEVIDRCWAQGAANPIKMIHDVGAGGLSNAIPELLDEGGVGARLSLSAIPNADPGLSPMAIWCNEAQERYVLGIAANDWPQLQALADNERCPVATLGQATERQDLVLIDDRPGQGQACVIDLPLSGLLGQMPPLKINALSEPMPCPDRGVADIELAEAIERVLRSPTVGSKAFLITIADRTVGGLSVRDPMVGPHQVPVSDCAITLRDYAHDAGLAMAIGERTPLAIWDAPASVRMAIGEALTNLSGVSIDTLKRVKLSANWMAAAGQPGQDAALHAAVSAARDLCVSLGVSIPVGKDSLSMHTQWRDEQDRPQAMTSPVSLIVSAFAGIDSVREHITPQLQPEPSSLVLIDFGAQRLGGSALAQVFADDEVRALGAVPDLDSPDALSAWLSLAWDWVGQGRLLACHDRSDGGLLACVFEMALAGHLGVRLDLPQDLDAAQQLAWLFNEELGVVVQVARHEQDAFSAALTAAGLGGRAHLIGEPDLACDDNAELVLTQGLARVYQAPMGALASVWSATAHQIQARRDNPVCADQDWAGWGDWTRTGLTAELTFDPPKRPIAVPTTAVHTTQGAPKVAILREQGVNGHREMAQSFLAAGFNAVDVTMSDLIAGRESLASFQGLAACGGFSYGDVLGAGLGWARSVLFNPSLRAQFEAFFADESTFALGVCNGCQMLAALRALIPGTDHWPDFRHNESQQFEARLSLVRIEPTPSVFFTGMAGSVMPVVTAHGEGQAVFASTAPNPACVALRYVDGHGQATERYPDNPNGSVGGVTGLCNDSGRVTILMPHPERLLRFENYSWAPQDWQGHSPWAKMFDNARDWIG